MIVALNFRNQNQIYIDEVLIKLVTHYHASLK